MADKVTLRPWWDEMETSPFHNRVRAHLKKEVTGQATETVIHPLHPAKLNDRYQRLFLPLPG